MAWFPEFLKMMVVLAFSMFCQGVDAARSLGAIQRNCAAVLAIVQASLNLIACSSPVSTNPSNGVEHLLGNAKEHLERICNGHVLGTYAYHIRHAHRNLAAAKEAVRLLSA